MLKVDTETRTRILEKIFKVIDNLVNVERNFDLLELIIINKKLLKNNFIKNDLPTTLIKQSELLRQSQIKSNIYKKEVLMLSILIVFNALYTLIKNSTNRYGEKEIDETILQEILNDISYDIERGKYDGDDKTKVRFIISELENLNIDPKHPLYEKLKALLKRLKYLKNKYCFLRKNVVYLFLIFLLTLMFLSYYNQLRNKIIGLEKNNKMLVTEIAEFQLQASGLLDTATTLINNNKQLLDLIKDYELYEKKALNAKVVGLSQSENIMNIFMRIKNFVMDLIRFKSQNWEFEELDELELLCDEIIQALYEMNKYWDKFL